MPPKNYTTSIRASRTVGEIQALLAQVGAQAIMIEYDKGRPVGLAFRLKTPLGVREFALPCKWQSVHKLLQGERRQFTTEEHALNVAWRTLQDWVEAQIAIIETEMVSVDQVFLSYMLTTQGKTVYDNFVAARLEDKEGK
jgi:hypothetical protein